MFFFPISLLKKLVLFFFDRKLQEDLTDEMVELAKQLKEGSLLMSQSIQNTEKVSYNFLLCNLVSLISALNLLTAWRMWSIVSNYVIWSKWKHRFFSKNTDFLSNLKCFSFFIFFIFLYGTGQFVSSYYALEQSWIKLNRQRKWHFFISCFCFIFILFDL